jgi:serine/threonine protein kinase
MIDTTALRLAPGDLLDGKYRIDSLLGEGGMGAVYRATHLGTTRTVAIKVIQPRFSSRPEFVARFRREAEAAGRLRHPNVVDVTDFGVTAIPGGRVAYLVMEFLDGCTLGDVLAEEDRLPVSWVVDILEQVCSALDDAHQQGMVHRDLKPDNIWLEPNRRGGYTVKVLDFGLVKLDVPSSAATRASGVVTSDQPVSPPQPQPPFARHSVGAERRTPTPASAVLDAPSDVRPVDADVTTAVEADGTRLPDAHGPDSRALTQIGSTLGTPFYMSPEQCRGDSVDARSDVYSLAVIAYRMLAGAPPFTGSGHEVMALHRSGEPRPLRELNPRVPHRVAELVMEALAKDPAARPKTAGGFAAALTAAAENSSALLRQAASLYSERFPVFLRVSCVAYLPLIVTVGLLALADSTQRFPYAVGVVLVLTMMAANLGAYFVVSAAVVPLVVQAIVAPLQAVRARAAWTVVRRRWRPFALATTLVVTGTLLGSLFLIVPGLLFALAHVLYAPVIVMESLPVGATLRRARDLARRARRTVLIISALQFALPILVWVASFEVDVMLELDEHWQPQQFGFGFATSGEVVVYQLINVVITPLTGIMTALLYLKTRHAGGESLRDAAERLAGVDVPRSRWQTRMRGSRARTHRDPATTLPTAPEITRATDD